MKEQSFLSHRRGTVLRIIVGDYIKRAIPVGSEHIAKGHSLGVSPATIRNDMAALEEEGYITHPHTSAGRIPSDKGYRYFVEDLRLEDELTPEERSHIRDQFSQWQGELEEWTHFAAELLANLIHAVALTSIPRAPSARFKRLELVALQEFLVLMVIILQETKVKQQLLRVEEVPPQEELTTMARRLSGAFEGLNVQEISPLVSYESPPFEAQVTRTVVQLMGAEDTPSSDAVYLEGLRNLLGQPEFTSAERLRNLVDLVEERHLLGALLPKLAVDQGVSVVIGRENPMEQLHDLSVVVAPYGIAGGLSGTLGVLGPTRLHYSRAISLVSYLSEVMTEQVAQHYG